MACEPVTIEETDSNYVDLGLSVKWATCNLGAEQPWEYGGYYAWGETTTKSSYSSDNYKYGNGSKMIKYCSDWSYGYQGFTDGKNTLESNDDAAYKNKGSEWRIPTYDELKELIDNCTWVWTTHNGINGYKVTSNKTGFKDKSIFLPAAGDNGTTNNTTGYYWSSNNQLGYNMADRANYLSFNESTIKMSYLYRYYGYSIRPVRP